MRTIFLLLLVILCLNSSSQNKCNPYQVEEDGFFVLIDKTENGILLTDNFASKLFLLQDNKLLKLVGTAGCGRYVSVSPDGKLVGFKQIDEQGYQAPALINLETGKITLLSPKTELCGQVSFSNSGHIAYTIGNILHVNNGDETKIFDLGNHVNITKINSSGTLLAFADVSGEIKVLDLISGEFTLVSDNSTNYAYPQWSPDGTKLLFQSEKIHVYDFITQELFCLGVGLGPKWSSNSQDIVFHKTEINDFELVNSDVYIARFNNSLSTRLTSTPDKFEMNPVFVSSDEVIFHTYNLREIISCKLNENFCPISFETLFHKPEPLEIAYYDVSKYYHLENKSVSNLGPAPYINQVYDTPDWHNGHGSCKPTTAVMAAAFYNRLPKWPTITDNESAAHYNDYGSYVADKYRYDELFFEINEPAYSTNAYGAYGYMWGTGVPTGTMQEYLEHHGMISNTIWTSSSSFDQTKVEIDLGYCHPLCTWITSVGHVKLAIGYVHGLHSVIFNDPYGNKNTPGYPSNDGAGAIYDWPGYNNGYANLDNDGTHGYIAWSTRARSQEPEYNDTIIDDVSYNHGFYIHNQIDNLGGGYNIQQYYRDRNAGYNGHFWWTYSVGSGSDVNYVSWTPTISEPGEYEVFAYVPSENATCTNALYKVFHAAGSDIVPINQNLFSDEWVSLGTYYFEIGNSGYAYLGDYSGTASQMIAFDAVKWSKINSPVQLNANNISCNGLADGELSAFLPGASPPVTYLWNNGQTTENITALSSGVYQVTVTDQVASYTASTTIYEPEELIVNISITQPTVPGASDGSIELIISGGTSPCSVIWSPSGQTETTITGLSQGTYSFVVSDVNSCEFTEIVEIADPSCIAPTSLVASSITYTSALLSWDDVSGVDGYAIRLLHEDWPLFTEYFSPSNSFNVSGLSSGSNYIWEVASICNPDSSVWASSVFTTSLTLSNITRNECSGVFTDPGGYPFLYSNNQDFTYTIAPTGAGSLTVIFDQFDMEAGSGATCDYDYLSIYDGPNTFAPLLGSYCNTTGSPGTIVSSGGSLHFVFHSDGSTVRPGWVARWFSDTYGCGLPVTAVNEPENIWQTEDFISSFSDIDNNFYGLDYRFYSAQQFNGTTWDANTGEGFLFDAFDFALGTDWINYSGTWTVSGGVLSQTNEAISNTNLYIPVTQSNEKSWLYEFDMKFISGDASRRAGIHVFCDDPTQTERYNSYLVWFRVEDNTVELWDNVNNIDYLRATETINLENGSLYNVKLLYNPDQYLGELTLFVNDVQIISWTDHTPHLSGNSISLRTRYANVQFDNIAIYQSRTGVENILIGNDLEDYIGFQNTDPSTPACKLVSLVIDYFDKVSDSEIRFFDVDWTNPTNVNQVNDGLGLDEDATNSSDELSANWLSASDPNSGIVNYYYAIGTSCGLNDLLEWTSSGISTSVSASGLSLSNGQTYYFSVFAENGAGLFSDTICSDGITASFTITSAVFSSETEVCEGEEVVYSNSSSNATGYLWTFEGGLPAGSVENEPTVIYSEPGTYSVSLIAFGSPNDTLISEDYISVHEAPIADFYVNSSELTLPSAIATFSNLSENAYSYFWNFGNGSTSTDSNPYTIYTEEGVFNVELLAFNQYCDADTATIVINVYGTSVSINSGNIEVNVFPNPFVDRLNLEYNLMEFKTIEITFTDISGKEIYSEQIIPVVTGKKTFHQLKNNFHELAPGVYFLNISIGDSFERVLLVKI